MRIDAEFHAVECDRCGEVHEDTNGIAYWMDFGDVWTYAQSDGWVELLEEDGSDKHYCPSCIVMDETDEDGERFTVKPPIKGGGNV